MPPSACRRCNRCSGKSEAAETRRWTQILANPRTVLGFQIQPIREDPSIQTLDANHPNAFGTSKTSKTTKILGLHRIAMDGTSETGFGCLRRSQSPLSSWFFEAFEVFVVRFWDATASF
jgi:hypothetical protein